MDLATRLTELAAKTQQHREVLLTEQAAKTALVMPFINLLGYDVFNPSEVVPEYVADVGTKKGEKVDYAICIDGKLSILIECKPSTGDLTINHASQLFRYFSVTDARLAILTNGVIYKFFSDLDQPNKMDTQPFFTLSLDAVRKSDVRILESFTKAGFDIDAIVREASNLKLESLVRKELESEMGTASEEFARLIAKRVYSGQITSQVKDNFTRLIANSFSAIVRDHVNDRLTSALNASAVPEHDEGPGASSTEEVITTEEEISGFRIVQAIASKLIDPKRVVMRDAKSYCAVLLDDNNRKSLARLHFNGLTTKYVGTFDGQTETRNLISDLTDIYKLAPQIEARISELDSKKGD
ncbi:MULTISPECIES: type I restriction endonuclease [unclassified Sphingomonas]|uniref:type I restriction endonuclease n=1 Tax=unclassified Sphingomonas TaxID=196159 RepID=UPI002151FBAD|nr:MULTISPECIES: type I restriction endonuclease [unclassified Sphingomonas]MCR5871680.1 type I restriction enzyme HsdR N-terminal domain-containing protein [Sphingomonas sp. J344]UUY00029.1 type I restriction enzyme HsdR N-terminal domain-containing protein [Sphingomonas sp. J315]